MSNGLVAGRIWGVHEEQRIKSDGRANYRLGSHGIKTEKIDEIKLAKVLNVNLRTCTLFYR